MLFHNGWSIHIKCSMDLTRTEWSAAIFGGFENPRWTSLHSCLRRCRRCQGGLRWLTITICIGRCGCHVVMVVVVVARMSGYPIVLQTSEPLIWYQCSLFALGWLHWLVIRHDYTLLEAVRWHVISSRSKRLKQTHKVLLAFRNDLANAHPKNMVQGTHGKTISERGKPFQSRIILDSFRSLSLPTVPPLPVLWPQFEAS